jgi:serine/threonine protein kinase/Tfp pilus assembly protein PilF
MNPVRPLDTDRDERFADILAACVEAVEGGASPPEVIARHAEFGPELRRFFAARDQLERLAPPPSGDSHQLSAEDPAAAILALGQLGDFRLLREVGRGGMGVVYEAEQLSLRRRVALKVLPFAAALDERQMQRFQNEAQAAAHLHHPHIVPVHAVGCERGVHFYAMQLIDGQTLAALVRDRRQQGEVPAGRPGLATPSADTVTPAAGGSATQGSVTGRAFYRRAAELGVQAAEALDYAHQQGVIHRDVKPANLLLDGHGRLWVTDFGLAQLQSNAGPTLSGDLVGTLRYMSPEQALARRGLVDHRTDVYALGATLYELVTLSPLFAGADRQELLRQVAFEDPHRPRWLNRAVPEELETVILKALAKDPAERYATAQEFAQDLRRFLEDRPVLARRPAPAQRLARWARRHKPLLGAVGVGLAVALAALAVSTVVTWQAYRAESAAHLAEIDRRRQTEANSLMAAQVLNQTLLELPDKQFPRPPRRKQEEARLFHQGVDYYERFVRTVPAEAESLPVKAHAYWHLGALYDRLGRADRAAAVYQQAAGLLDGLAVHDPATPVHRRDEATVLNNLGTLYEQERQLAKAEAAHCRARDLRQALAAEHPETPEHRQELAESLANLGLVLAKTGRAAEAEQLLRQAVAHREALAADFPAEGKYRGELAVTANHLAVLLWTRKQNPEAEALLLRSRKVLGELAAQSFHPMYPLQLAHTHHQLGLLWQATGRAAEAAAAYRDAITQERRLTAEFSWVPEFQQDLATSLAKVGEVLTTLDQAKDAEAALREALELAGQVRSASPTTPASRDREVIVAARTGLAAILTNGGRLEEAEAILRQAVADWHQLVADVPDSPDHRNRLAAAHFQMGKLQAERGRPREAEGCYREATDYWEKLATDFPQVPAYRHSLSVAHRHRGQLLQAAGRLGEAEQAVRPAVSLLDRLAADYPAVPAYRQGRALAQGQLAALLADTPRHSETAAAFHEALALAAELAKGSPKAAASRTDLAAVHDRWGRWLMTRGLADEAEPHFREAVALLERLTAEHAGANCPRQLAWLLATCPHPGVRDAPRAVALARQAADRAPQSASAWGVLGAAHGRAGEWPAALAAVQRAVALPGGGDATDYFWLALAQAHLGRPDLARASYETAVRRMEADEPGDRELGRLRAEAEGLLRRADAKDSPGASPDAGGGNQG